MNDDNQWHFADRACTALERIADALTQTEANEAIEALAAEADSLQIRGDELAEAVRYLVDAGEVTDARTISAVTYWFHT